MNYKCYSCSKIMDCGGTDNILEECQDYEETRIFNDIFNNVDDAFAKLKIEAPLLSKEDIEKILDEKPVEKKEDVVHHPNHYMCGELEVIDIICNVVGGMSDPFNAYCTGNVIKYICRWFRKNGYEDLEKAKVYIDFILKYKETKTVQRYPEKLWADIAERFKNSAGNKD